VATDRWRRLVLTMGAVLLAAPLSSKAQSAGAPARDPLRDGGRSDEAARPIRLRDAVEQAQRNAPAAVAARGLERNAAAANRSALAAYMPALTLNAGSARTQGVQFFQGALVPLRGDPWNYNNGLAASLQLFDGNQRWHELSRSRAVADAADAAIVQARFDASLQTKQQFYAALAARGRFRFARALLTEAEQQLKASTARFVAGVATKSDSLRSAIQLGNARLAVLTAENDRRVANAALTRVIGSPVLVTPALDDTVDATEPLPSEQELEQLIARSPTVMQAEANLMAARASRKSQRSAYLPSLTMSYNYAYTQTSRTFSSSDLWLFSGGNPNRQQLNFNFSYPLFNGLVREQQSVQTDVALRNAEAQLRDARLGARQTLTQQLRALDNAEARAGVQVAAIAAAEEDLRVQQQRYALGASTLLDLLTSQTQLNQARQALIQARFDGRIARAQLSALIGREM
jgi:outer membrane protein